MTIEQLHIDLEFASVEPQLRGVQGVWDRLVKLQDKARGDPQALPAYKQFLERCIKQLSADEELTPEQTVAACERFMTHLVARIEEAGIYAIQERRGGQTWEAWMAKWLPLEYDRYAVAMAACNEKQTAKRFAALDAALDTVLTAYVGAID